MTVNTSKYHIKKICKNCPDMYYDSSLKHKHQCKKIGDSIYENKKCKKILSIRKEAVETWRKARDEAFFALTGRCYHAN